MNARALCISLQVASTICHDLRHGIDTGYRLATSLVPADIGRDAVARGFALKQRYDLIVLGNIIRLMGNHTMRQERIMHQSNSLLGFRLICVSD